MALAALVLLLAGCAAPAQADVPAWQVRAYSTGNASELVTTLPVTVQASLAKRVVFCLDLGDAPAGGEVLHADADVEVTNDLGVTVNVITHLVLGDSCQSTSGTEIAEAQGGNVTPSGHHHTATRGGTIIVEPGNSRRFLVLVAWSAYTQATPGMVLTVDQDYGRLSALRFTPV